jgi:hypothetical protein
MRFSFFGNRYHLSSIHVPDMHSRKIQTTYIAEDTVGEVQSFIKAIRRVRYCHGQRLVHRVTGPIVVTTFSLSIPADPI